MNSATTRPAGQSSPAGFAAAPAANHPVPAFTFAEALRVATWHLHAAEFAKFRGTAEQLLAYGLVRQEHLPQLGNDRRHTATFFDERMWTSPGIPKGGFKVTLMP